MPTLYERQTDISIIIPVYNLEEYIGPMLDSLKSQELGGYTAEVIFVLNNCTDRSEEIIRESGIECKILNCTTQGCGPARNVGLKESEGYYIWFIDGDDWLLSKTSVCDVLDKAFIEELEIMRIPYKSTFREYFSMVWQYLIRRDLIGEIRFPNYQPGEDDAFMDAVLNEAGYSRENYTIIPCLGVPQYFYNYLREGSNMTRVRLGESI